MSCQSDSILLANDSMLFDLGDERIMKSEVTGYINAIVYGETPEEKQIFANIAFLYASGRISLKKGAELLKKTNEEFKQILTENGICWGSI